VNAGHVVARGQAPDRGPAPGRRWWAASAWRDRLEAVRQPRSSKKRGRSWHCSRRSSSLCTTGRVLAARSIIEVALRPVNHLTQQANSPFREASKVSASRPFRSDSSSRPYPRVEWTPAAGRSRSGTAKHWHSRARCR
jgi:hypothetical protein